jgi:phage baseplate assembly protein W
VGCGKQAKESSDVSDKFIGAGWPLRLPEGPTEIKTTSGNDHISQSIWIILGTAPGERVMRPDFGCGIHDLVFAVNNASTIGQITSLVQQALTRWEPRIDVLQVGVTPDGANPTLLLIEIGYRVRTTNSRFNLVYPFYLE